MDSSLTTWYDDILLYYASREIVVPIVCTGALAVIPYKVRVSDGLYTTCNEYV